MTFWVRASAQWTKCLIYAVTVHVDLDQEPLLGYPTYREWTDARVVAKVIDSADSFPLFSLNNFAAGVLTAAGSSLRICRTSEAFRKQAVHSTPWPYTNGAHAAALPSGRCRRCRELLRKAYELAVA
jgi:hypothetical protein